MPWLTLITRIELGFPLIEKLQRRGGIPSFIAEIAGDAAVRVNIIEMLPQTLRQEPCRDGEIFVVAARQPLAV